MSSDGIKIVDALHLYLLDASCADRHRTSGLEHVSAL